ncbi:hypothetical protein H4R99_004472 [Coemansia sp. RSA 1722]|nr:hypothetical protein LPJ57_002854 [Coemansia sp. RSA 486]KAJ2230726.1 hypothetical protein IWW45_005693 [Coemansia sp. RSA 485]KAJ2595695.1 hypothetical protein GGF39_003730 [Coemansia sp. RSA 1721]KAJ2597516.1 hypothetical protein H4R99_004472 [Coemansia sp. RSA 1722]KAJ2635210.1 hypothetical protein GGF40_003751 [Coemansia sp. RSA 1286]
MPGRPKRMRYTFVNQTRSAQQPVYAWKKTWASPKSAGIDDISSGQTIVHEDDEDDNVNQQQQQQSTQEQAIEENSVDTADQSLVQENVPQEQGVSENTAAENTANAVDAAVAAVEDIATSMSSAPASSDLAQATQEQDITTKPQEDQSSDIPHDTIQCPVSQHESLNASDDKPCEPSAPSEEAVAAAAAADDDGKDARSSFPDTQARSDEENTAAVDSALTESAEQMPVAEESQTNDQPVGDSGALPQKPFDEVSDAAPSAAVASDVASAEANVDSAAADADASADVNVSANADADADGIATDANVDSAAADANVSAAADANVSAAADANVSANADADTNVGSSVADSSVAAQTTTQPATP